MIISNYKLFVLLILSTVGCNLLTGEEIVPKIEPSLSIDDVTFSEDSSIFVFTVSLSEISNQAVSVDYGTTSGTAVLPDDYGATSGTLTIPAGSVLGSIPVTIVDDLVSEDSETFTVDLRNATNATISDKQGEATIKDNDGASSLSIDDVTVDEGNSGSVNAVFTVSLSLASSDTVSVDYTTSNGTAKAPGDYSPVSLSTLIFTPGVMKQTITVVVNGDVLVEPDETFKVDLSNASNATISDNQGQGTITDNDNTVPSFSIDDVTVNEGDNGTVDAVFTMSLSYASSEAVSVDYATSNGTAKDPDDYNRVSLRTLSFAPGVTKKSIKVEVNGDLLNEANETFMVDLSNATNATISDKQGQGTITDDDEAAPSISIDDVIVNEGNSGTLDAVFSVSLSSASSQTVSVDYATSNGTATAPGDYNSVSLSTLSFSPGITTQTITVAVNGDLLVESNETFAVALSNATNASILDNQAEGKIIDDDAVASANLIFEETFEGPEPFSTAHSMDVGDWDYALQFVNSPAYEGNRSARFEIREDQPLVSSGKRSEVVIVKGADGEIAENTWYSFAVYFPTDGYAYDNEREIINQWYQGGSPATSLRTDEGRILLETGNELDNRQPIDIGPITKDEWHTFVFHFIHSYGSNGLIEVWYDGNKIITHTGGNMYDDVLPKWKIGLYKSAFKYGTSDVDKRVIYFDHIKVGDENATYDDMIPGNE